MSKGPSSGFDAMGIDGSFFFKLEIKQSLALPVFLNELWYRVMDEGKTKVKLDKE